MSESPYITRLLAAASELSAAISTGEVDKRTATTALGGAIVTCGLDLQAVLAEARQIRANFQRKRCTCGLTVGVFGVHRRDCPKYDGGSRPQS